MANAVYYDLVVFNCLLCQSLLGKIHEEFVYVARCDLGYAIILPNVFDSFGGALVSAHGGWREIFNLNVPPQIRDLRERHSSLGDLLVIENLHVDLANGVSIEVFSLVCFRIRYRFNVTSVFSSFHTFSVLTNRKVDAIIDVRREPSESAIRWRLLPLIGNADLFCLPERGGDALCT